jgi:hypothetical protein
MRLRPLLAASLFAAGAALACDAPHPLRSRLAAVSKDGAADSRYWIGPGVSGAWFDPARSGEGVVLQLLPDGRAFLVWFTYPAAGETGTATWLLGAEGRREGSRLVFEAVAEPAGARFGDAFREDAVSFRPWGRVELDFVSCTRLTLRWQGRDGYGSGERVLGRLSVLDEIDCAGSRRLTASGGRALDGLRSRSGAWFVPGRAGEGWLIEELAGGQSLVYWFTYDAEGRQLWLVGNGRREGDRLQVDTLLQGGGTRFGSGFDPAAVALQPWGSLQIDFDSCQRATLRYASSRPGFGSAERVAERLTTLAGAPCLDPLPAGLRGLGWRERASTPLPAQSELAVTSLDGQLYALGGFGAPRGFRRYDPVANVWATLPDLPAGRDHLAAFALDGGVYYSGGAPLGPGQQDVAAFRFDVAGSRWEPVPELAFHFGSHAAVLNGYAYIGNAPGSLQQFDPRGRHVRSIAAPDFTQRDHSQVVAFMDEIWVIAGRSPETRSVAIYDPVAERWRAGPPIRHARGGFAAAAVGRQIVITGGEVLEQALYVEGRSELYEAGAEAWEPAPDLPVPVHGTAGAGIDGRFLVVGGATEAGTTRGAAGRTFELDLR